MGETRLTASTQTDDALLEAFSRGEPAAARKLLARHIGSVLALANRMLKDRGEAEDVAQETFLAAWKMASAWEPERAQFTTWLHKVAMNKCLDRLRKKKPEPMPEGMDVASSALDPEADLLNGELGTRVNTAIQALPERQRAAISLSLHGQLSNPEIAETLAVSVEAVESLLARARRTLKDRLRQDWLGLVGDMGDNHNVKERIGK
ncbi:MAG: RNA polymerase sigma factor [Parvibaculaceae bacterium]|nr:RNA polymerase sigma factor [Parvibaculaceae bacterium]